MSEPVVIAPAAGEVIGDAPDRRVEILCDHDALHVTWSRFAAGRDGADLHVHHHHSDLFYVLAGELTLRLGAEGAGVVLPAGTLARVPPHVVHGFRNASGAEVRYLNLHAPGREFANFMRAVRDGRTPPAAYDQHPPPADGGRPASEAVIGTADLRVDRSGRRAAILADTDDIAIAEEVREPGDPARPPLSRSATRWLYVLDGELAFTSGERTLRAPAGSWLQVPAGLPHALASAGAEPVRYLELRAPGRASREPGG